jgi:alkylhydroperoxidase/carboxymuconolactone decarboxylase family protein YurZ
MRSVEEKSAFKERYIAARGYWVPFNDGLLEHSPEWLEAYLAYSSTPARTGPLSARMRELLYVAVDASTTHLFQAGLEIHVRIALASGCTVGELIEVLQIATMQGIDSISIGMTTLIEELAASGRVVEDHPDTPAVLARYAAQHSEPPEWLPAMARLSPAWVEALGDLLDTADRTSRLTACERALIRLGLAASPTHLYPEGVRVEVRRALDLGASPQEIAQVFQLVAHLGLHACSEGVPTIMRVAAEA